MSRLTLSPIGIRSPAALIAETPADQAQAEVQPPTTKRRAKPRSVASSRKRLEVLPPESASGAVGEGSEAASFFGMGRRIQTSVMLEPGLALRLREVAVAGHVSLNALLVAVLEQALPLDDPGLRALLREDERGREPGVETNVRVPMDLRVRLDELVASLPTGARVARAHVINALLRRDLPADAHRASELVEAFERRAAETLLA